MLKKFHNWMTFICQLVSAGSEVIDKLCTMSPHLLFKSCHNLKYFQHHFLFAKDRTQKLPYHKTKEPQIVSLFLPQVFWSNHCCVTYWSLLKVFLKSYNEKVVVRTNDFSPGNNNQLPVQDYDFSQQT